MLNNPSTAIIHMHSDSATLCELSDRAVLSVGQQIYMVYSAILGVNDMGMRMIYGLFLSKVNNFIAISLISNSKN